MAEDTRLSIAQQNVMNSPTFLNNIPFLIQKQIDIYVLNEPPRNISTETVGVPFIGLEKGRTAIVILNQAIDYEFVKDESNEYVTTIKLSTLKLKIRSVYIPPNQKKTGVVAEGLVLPFLKQHNSSTLILGDVNATLRALGDYDCERGSKLLACIDAFDWLIINKPNVPTRKKGKTCIDWSIVSKNIGNELSWTCSRHDKSIADHCIIYISTNFHQLYANRLPVKTYIDIKKFISNLSQFDYGDVVKDISKYVEISTVNSLCNVVRKRKQEFFDEKCLISKQVVNRVRRKVKKHGSRHPQLLDELREANRIHAANIASAKERHWASKLTKCKNVGDIFHLIKANRVVPNYVHNIVDDSGPIDDPVEVSKAALNHFFPQTFEKSSLSSYIMNGPKDLLISGYEVDCAMANQKTITPGMDRVNLHVVQAIHHSFPNLLRDTYNDWFSNEKIPEKMKHAVITLIKKEDGLSNRLGNLRPLSLTNIMVKIFERILCARFIWHLEQTAPNDMKTVIQFGYGRGLGAEDALRAVVDAREEFKMTKDIIMALDVKDAFNSVSHQAIVREIVRLGTPRSLVNIFIDYLSDRKISLNLAENVSTSMIRGVPQGTILGPIFFKLAMNVFVNNLSKLLECSKLETRIIAYVDDVTLILRRTELRHNWTQLAPWLLRQVDVILQNVGLKLNLKKTQILSVHTQLPVNIDDISVPVKARAKILGVEFGVNNYFKGHLKEKLEKVEMQVYALKCYTSSLTLSLSSRIALVKSSIHSLITYAADIFFSTAPELEIIRKFLYIDRLIATHLYGSSFTSSYRSTVIILGRNSLLFSVILAAERKSARYEMRREIDRELWKRCEIKTHPADRSQISFRQAKTCGEILHPLNMTLAIFTDGSAKQGEHATTAAFVTWCPRSLAWTEYWFKLLPYASAYAAERHAVEKAVTFVYENCMKGVFHILTDSLSTLQAIQHQKPKDLVISRIKYLVYSCSMTGKQIFFTWVKAHGNVAGNIMADEACGRALNSFVVPEYTQPSSQEVRRTTNDRSISRFSALVRPFFINLEDSLVESPEDVMKLKLDVNFHSAAFYSNRAPTRVRLKKLGLVETDICLCGHMQKIRHLFLECPLVIEMYQKDFNNTGMSKMVGKELSTVMASKEFHLFIKKISKKLLGWLEENNGFSYLDTRRNY